jgi:hypothetical protein
VLAPEFAQRDIVVDSLVSSSGRVDHSDMVHNGTSLPLSLSDLLKLDFRR